MRLDVARRFVLLPVLAVVASGCVVLLRPVVASAVAAPVTVSTPELVRSFGAELVWSRFVLPAGADFVAYEVHRSSVAGFAPGDSSRIGTVKDVRQTWFNDVTAAPSASTSAVTTWYYRVVTVYKPATTPVESSASAQVAVVAPVAGTARLTVQPSAARGQSALLRYDSTTPAACNGDSNWGNYGYLYAGMSTSGFAFRSLLRFDLRSIPVGSAVTAATLTLTAGAQPRTSAALNVRRVTRDWSEGTEAGACGASGASWSRAENGVPWTVAGGDVGGVDATIAARDRAATSTDAVNLQSLVNGWVSGSVANLGIEIGAQSEATVPTADNYVIWYSDDAAASRPKLEVTFNDALRPAPSRVTVAAPAPGEVVRGAVSLSAGASDDGRVAKVAFLVDGALVGEDTTAPFTVPWDSASTGRGAHSVVARVTDDAGNETASTARSFTVDNSAAPSGSLSPLPAMVAGTVPVSMTASDDVAVDRVEFVVDGTVVGYAAAPATAPTSFAYSWDTLDPLVTTYDGSHHVEAVAVDDGGRRTVLGAQDVIVNNTDPAGSPTEFQATLRLLDGTGQPVTGVAAGDLTPSLITDNANAGAIAAAPDYYSAPSQGGLAGAPKDSTTSMTSSATPAGAPSAPARSGATVRRRASASGSSSTGLRSAATGAVPAPSAATSSGAEVTAGATPAACPADAYCPTVRVTNASPVAWKGGDLRVWYRWYTPTGAVAFEGPATDSFPQTFQRFDTRDFPLVIYPPALPPGAELGQFRLRVDLYDTVEKTWFAAKGNAPLDNPVIVAKALSEKLGFEKFWTYESGQTGAGSFVASNVANGNLLWRWSPWASPGQGLATLVDLTYNSLEDHSRSPVGESFSLSVSGLSRFGEPIEIHPNKADQISGKANKFVEFVDGDGTVHRFEGNADGTWQRPAGVHLYLRSVSTDPLAERYWAISRPDAVTFYYDHDGFPTAVVDRNGNTIRYELADTPPGEDPGGPKRRIVKVWDARNRAVTVAYWSKAEEKRARVRGKVKRLLDHSNSALDFEYYDDGNLRRLIQRGGAGTDGDAVADRAFVFTYTTSNGSGPSIADPADRVNPAERTPDQSTKLFSVRDPRGRETTFSYYGPQPDPKLRWKIKARTDRAGATTTYGYDLAGRVTTVTNAAGYDTRYDYDPQGRVTAVTNPKGERTGYAWSTDNHVTTITEPNLATQSFAYNDAGYLTERTNQEGETTRLDYEQRPNYLSLLSTVVEPLGVASTTVPDDYTWRYTYDSVGNLVTSTDPDGYTTSYDWNVAPDVAAGTLQRVVDPRLQPGSTAHYTTTYEKYDENGLATSVVDAGGGRSRFRYDEDGQLVWSSTPTHDGFVGAGLPERQTGTVTDYDAFHRPVRTSTPKSTATTPGLLVWSGRSYDANNNVTVQRNPSYGFGEPGGAPVGTVDYDDMDRPTRTVGADQHLAGGEVTTQTYDTLGRLATETVPRGNSTSVAGDFTTTYTYDTVNRRIGIKRVGASGDPERQSWSCYDAVGNHTAEIQPKAGLTGHPGTACPYPAASTPYMTRMYYDKAHRVIASRDALDRQTTQDYDANGRVVASTDEAGTRKTLAYNQRGLIVEQRTPLRAGTTPRTLVSRAVYDEVGNLVKDITPRAVDLGTTTQYVTEYTYDGLNRTTRVKLPSDTDTGPAYEHMVYDTDGRLTTKTLPLASDTLPGDLPASAATTTAYYDTGWIAASQTPGNPQVLFDYTAEGWQATRVPRQAVDSTSEVNESLRMRWSYFADGQVRSRYDEHGLPVTFDYDQDNNLVTATLTSGVVTPDEQPRQTKAVYDGFDELVRAGETKLVSPTTARVENYTTYDYDRHGLLVGRGDEGQAGATSRAVKRNAFAYDDVDRMVQQFELGRDPACADDRRIVSQWSAQDWLVSRTMSMATASCTAEKSTDPAVWQATQVERRGFLLTGDLESSTTTNGAGAVQESHQLSYDQGGAYVGQRTKDTFTRVGPTAGRPCSTTACTATWTFDARNRLVQATDGKGGNYSYRLDETGQQAYGPVRAGNVTTEVTPKGTTTRRYVGNQMTETSVTAPGASTATVTKTIYDDLGRTDCVVTSAGSAADCRITGSVSANLVTDYSYDYLDRLQAVRSYRGGALTDESTYASDALDRTVRQVESHVRTGTQRRSTSFEYLGLTEQLAKETQSTSGSTSGTAAADTESVKSYSYDAYGQRTRLTDSSRSRSTTGVWSAAAVSSATYGYDPHGSVSLLLRESGTSAGQARASYGYTPYGDLDAGLSDGDTDRLGPFNPFQFSGQRFDSGSQTLQAGARRYDPGSTRFLQQDLFRGALADVGLSVDPLSQNRYALAAGNPTSLVEVDGHRPAPEDGSAPLPQVSSQDTAGSAGGGSAAADGPSATEVAKALEVSGKDWDWKKELVKVGLDFLGVSDITHCLRSPSLGGCASALLGVLPWGKVFKAGKIAKRLWALVGDYQDWQKARRAADAVLDRAFAFNRRADGMVSQADNPGLTHRLTGDAGPDIGRGLDETTGKAAASKAQPGTTHHTSDTAANALPALPKALSGGAADTYVYFGTRGGKNVYTGITNDLTRRGAQHGERFDQLVRVTNEPVTRGQARSIEQALIARNPGFENKINSISPTHSYYDDAVSWGEAWLRQNGF